MANVIKARQDALLAEYKESFQKAIRNEYSLIKISVMKYQVIQRIGIVNFSYGANHIATFKTVSPKLNYEQAIKELIKLRGLKDKDGKADLSITSD